MYQLLLIIVALFIGTLVYTYGISRLTQNKLILLAPAEIGIVWYLLQLWAYFRETNVGFEGLNLYFATLFIIVVLFTNLFFGYLFLKKLKKR